MIAAVGVSLHFSRFAIIFQLNCIEKIGQCVPSACGLECMPQHKAPGSYEEARAAGARVGPRNLNLAD